MTGNEAEHTAEKISDRELRLDGYLVSDITDCLVIPEPDTIERFRKAETKPEFNHFAGFLGNLWFAKWGMLDVSLWIIVINMIAVPLIAAAYGWLNRGDLSLPYDTNYVYIYIGLVLILEIYPLGRIGDRLLWKRTRAILDSHGCRDRMDEEDAELRRKLAEEGRPSGVRRAAVFGLDLLCLFFCKQITTLAFLYFGYTR